MEEADTDVDPMPNPASTPHHNTTTTLCKASRRVAVPPATMGLPPPPPIQTASPCRTPLLGDVENYVSKQRHTLHTYDSGFSDWTPDSAATSVPSLSGTPSCLHDGSPFSDPQSLAASTSESDSVECFLRHNNRRSWPLRSRKLSFQLPDTDVPLSPELNMQLRFEQENNSHGCMNLNTNTNNSSQSEEELKIILSKSSITKHSHVDQFLARSRSGSRSPLSSVSDEFESSFQEMSLEDSSSSDSGSNLPSPTPLTSSSPVFSFKHQHTLNETLTPKLIPQNERKLSLLSRDDMLCNDAIDNTTTITDEENCSLQQINSALSYPLRLDPSADIDQVNFASSLSLIPTPESSKKSPHSFLSSTSLSPLNHVGGSSHLSSLPHIPTASSLLPCCGSATAHPCSACCQSNIPSSSVSDFNFIKSPFKRRSCELPIPQRHNTEAVSPQKMRKVRLRRRKSFPKASSDQTVLKRDLFDSRCNNQNFISSAESESVVAQTQSRVIPSPDERIPQFVSIHAVVEEDVIDEGLEENSPANPTHHATPTSRWQLSKHKNKNVKKERCQQEVGNKLVIDRICQKFSPCYPSQLIGRHVGVKKFDILGELQHRGLNECVKIILFYIPDTDLLKITQVNADWKYAVIDEPKAHWRYKNLYRKTSSPRKLRNRAEKENVVGKLHEDERLLMTSSKGHLTSIQPQSVAADHSTPGVVPQEPELLSEDCIRNCPHCQCRAVVIPSQDRATCLSDKCAYDFCTKCFFPFHHPSPCKPLFHCASKNTLAGTKKSKKNLKRLKTL